MDYFHFLEMTTLGSILSESLAAALYQSLAVDRDIVKFLKREGSDVTELVSSILDYSAPPNVPNVRARAAPKKGKGEQLTEVDHREHLDQDYDTNWKGEKGFCVIYYGKAGDKDGNNKYNYCGKASKKSKYCCITHATTKAGKTIIEKEQNREFKMGEYYDKTEKRRIKEHKDALRDSQEPWSEVASVKGKNVTRNVATVFALVPYKPNNKLNKKYRYESNHCFVVKQTEVDGKIIQEVQGVDEDCDGTISSVSLDQYKLIKQKGPSVTVLEEALDDDALKVFKSDKNIKATLTGGKSLVNKKPVAKVVDSATDSSATDSSATDSSDDQPIVKSKVVAAKSKLVAAKSKVVAPIDSDADDSSDPEEVPKVPVKSKVSKVPVKSKVVVVPDSDSDSEDIKPVKSKKLSTPVVDEIVVLPTKSKLPTKVVVPEPTQQETQTDTVSE